jgi:DNA-binding transcriptional MocR family regulator
MTQKTSAVRLKASHVIARPITWAQLSLEASEALRGLISREPKAAQLILALIERMEPGGAGVVVVSRTTMAELIGVSVPTIARALALLMEEGWVQRIRVGSAPALAINHRVAWVGARGDIQHAVFGATVIASRSEQDAMSLTPPPMRQVPVIRSNEIPLMTGPGQEPPSQPDLEGVPPVVAMMANADGVISDEHIARLEAAGQLRITELESV